jgi:hypothetical protein
VVTTGKKREARGEGSEVRTLLDCNPIRRNRESHIKTILGRIINTQDLRSTGMIILFIDG